MSKTSDSATGAVFNVAQTAYNATIREHLPRKWVVYDTVPARDGRLFDFQDRVDPYKTGLKRAIRENIGDKTVVLVGAGRGVSSVWLAEQGAEVIAYEAAEEMLSLARETVAMQDYSNAVDIRHALVGEAVDVFGSFDSADAVPPSELNTHDALVMDCEGAERSILAELDDYPETLIVEAHPERGVPTQSTYQTLQARGYDVETLPYERGRPRKRVLVGTKQ